MASLNRWTGIGRLGKDPEIRSLSNGNRVGNFSLACNEITKDRQGNKKESVEWIACSCWNAMADLAGKYMHKGDQVYVEGRIKSRSWGKDGETRTTTEIHVSNIVLIGNSQDRNAGRNSEVNGNVAEPWI